MKRNLLYVLAAMLCAMMLLGGCSKVDKVDNSKRTEESSENDEFKPMEPDEDVTIELDEDEDYQIN